MWQLESLYPCISMAILGHELTKDHQHCHGVCAVLHNLLLYTFNAHYSALTNTCTVKYTVVK